MFHYSLSTTMASHATNQLLDTTTFPTDATDTITSAASTAHQPDSPKVQYHSSKVTYLYTSAFYLADPKRLSRPHLRDPSYATMET